MDTPAANPSKTVSSQIRIQLSTSSPDIALPQDPGPILVNTNFRRYALSTLVNTLLQNEKAVPFEFIINGQFLRTTIDEYLTQYGLSAENTLALEYVRATIPPLHLASFEHDDWVSSVDVSSTSPGSTAASHILSGSYDGILRIWNTSSEIIASQKAHQDTTAVSSIKRAKFLSPTRIASGSMDGCVRLWKFQSPDSQTQTASLTEDLQLYGHTAAIENVATHEASQRILSASGDHTVGLWSSQKKDGPAAPVELVPSNTTGTAKRRKIGPAVSVPQRGPLRLLQSHTAPVSAVIFAPHDHTVAHSTSWDHALKTWDLPTGTCVDTRSTSHALLSLTALPSLNLLATGTSARHITLIDPRATASTISSMTLRGHTNAVVALATNPESPYSLVSGSHDGTCRIWDLRSSRSENEGRVGESVYCIERQSAEGTGRRVAGQGIKVLDVCWDAAVGIVSAGEDKQVQINSGQGSTVGVKA